MSRLVIAHGGTFAPDLYATCTHLIVAPIAVQASRRASPKLAYARKWDISIVNVDWLYESISKRICLDYQQFKVEQLALSQEISSNGYTQNFLYDDLTVGEVANIMLPPYLEGLHIYVGDQLPWERLALLKKLILNAGGTRYSDLYDKSLITHYIVHNQTVSPKDIEQLRQFGDNVPIVTHDQWLFACFYAKERVLIDPFVISTEVLLKKPEEDTKIETPLATKNTVWSLKSLSSHTRLESQVPDRVNSLPTFSGVKFKLSLYKEPIKLAQITDIVEKNGGIIVSENADYEIGPLLGMTTMLNELWLDSCIIQNCIVDPTLSRFYSTLIVHRCAGNADFSSCRISITGYSGLERDYYAHIITALGACYTENLSKKNTHLIVATTIGPKYEFAKHSKIFCIRVDWLIESAKAGKPLDLTEFEISDCKSRKEDGKTPECQDKFVPALSISKRSIEIETPVRNEITKKLKEAAATVTPTGLTQDAFSSATNVRMDISNILGGYIFAISQRLWHRREEIHDLVAEMGGLFVWSYDTSCTHYIHQGNMMEETFREFKTVRQHGKWIVSPFWLLKSREIGKRLSEFDFPHTYNPNHIIGSGSSGEIKSQPLDLIQAKTMSPPLESLTIDFDAIIAADRKYNRPTITYSLSPQSTKTILRAINDIPKIFALSALTPDQRNIFPMVLSELRATMLKSSSGWESETTHLVIGVLSKSEKFLCACAAGIWVLRPEYVEACQRETKLVNERNFEWQSGWSDGDLAKVPKYWREACIRSGKKAFNGWNVLLVADQKRLPSLKAILVAGEAKVHLLGDPGLETEAPNMTHALVSSTQMKARISPDLQAKLTGKFHNVDLIAEYLINFDKRTT